MKVIYKIIAAVGALASIPLMFFGNLIAYKMESAGLETLMYLGQLFGLDSIKSYVTSSGEMPKYIGDESSIYELYQLLGSVSGFEGDGSIAEKLEILFAPVATIALVLALIAVCAIVTAVFAFVCKDNRKVIYSSIAGIGLSFMLPECVEALAEIVLSGKIKFSTIFNTAFADMIGTFEELNLSSDFWFVPLVFGAVIIWTLLYNATLPPEEKLERRLLLGEEEK